MTKDSQNERLLEYLTPPGRTITTYAAFMRFGITRLSARIFDLSRPPFNKVIGKETVNDKKKGKKYLKYFLK